MLGFRLYLCGRNIPEGIISPLGASHRKFVGGHSVVTVMTVCEDFVVTRSPARFTAHNFPNPSFHPCLLSSLLNSKIVLFLFIYLSFFLSTYLFISIWTHGLLSYAMGYNPLLFLLILMFKLFKFRSSSPLSFFGMFSWWLIDWLIDLVCTGLSTCLRFIVCSSCCSPTISLLSKEPWYEVYSLLTGVTLLLDPLSNRASKRLYQ